MAWKKTIMSFDHINLLGENKEIFPEQVLSIVNSGILSVAYPRDQLQASFWSAILEVTCFNDLFPRATIHTNYR